MQSDSHPEINIIVISVVRDFIMYNQCIAHNQHANVHTLHTIDNRTANEHISIQYNRFLDTYDYTQPAWFIFCHEDFEMLENPEKLLKKAHQDSLYGPIGATTKTVAGCLFKWKLLGTIYEAGKDGQTGQQVGTSVPLNTPVETFDCQCLIVHSSLILNTGLRFDPRLSFDLYIEDFCIQAKEYHSISSLILPLRCKHWSHGQTGARYFQQEKYLNTKYQNCCYTGTSSYSLGKPRLLRRLNGLLKNIIKKINSCR
jgi:hypothetical protein